MNQPNNDSYLRRGAVTLSLVMFGGYLVDYAFNLGLTRILSVHDYGDFKVAYAFATFFGLAVLLGGDRAAPMVLSPCIEGGRKRQVGEYLRLYLLNALYLGCGLITVTWIISFWHHGSSDPTHHHPLAWVVVAVPINAVGAMISRTIQSARHPARAAVPWRFGLPLLQLALFAVVVAVRGELSGLEAIAIAIVSTFIITVWQGFDLRRLDVVDFEREHEFRTPRRWLTASLPMMGSFLVALALNQSDLYFLELLGDEGEVGHYAAAATVAHFIPLVQVTIVGLIAPLARPAIDAGAASSRATFRRASSLLIAWVLPTVLFLVVFGDPILSLFDPTYRVGGTVLLFLVLGNFGWALAALSSLWLQYRDRARIVLVVSIVTLVVDSGLNLYCIPRYGMTGAAVSTAVTLVGASIAVLIAHSSVQVDVEPTSPTS